MKHYKQKENFESRILSSLATSLVGLVKLPFGKKGAQVDRAKLHVAWQEIERLAQGSLEELKIAVVQADNIVDSILREKVQGKTMGDRLKSAQNKFSYQTYQNLWEAHKLRNNIAHEVHFVVSEGQLKIAMSRFRKAMQEIGIL